MNNDKRLIFSVTPGRSGTLYLTQLLQGLPDIHAEHEPAPGFRQWLPQARYDAALAKRLLVEQKLPFIYSFSEKTFIEISHYFSKGFLDPLMDLGIVPDLILLKREPRKVASSRYLIGGGMAELKAGQYYKHILGPHEPNFLPAQNFHSWNDYQLCFWYALETFSRMRHYAPLVASRGGKLFEMDLPSLVSGDSYGRLLEWLNVPEEIIRERVSDTQARKEKVNLLLEGKQRYGRTPILASLDLDALEAQVLKDCGLPPDYVSTVMQMPVITPALAATGAVDAPRIFVCIPSYRDPECQWTVKDLFEKAAHPERVNVGICRQSDPKADQECFAIPSPRPKQTRIVEYHIRDSKGANWARAQAMALKRDEEHVLVIDSHMRFEPGWDESLLEALKRCPSEKALLTAWLPGYKPPDALDADAGRLARLRVYDLQRDSSDAQLMNLNCFYVPADAVCGRMDAACSLVANCMFGPAKAFDEAPFDPHIDFWGDEINQSARLWTSGWDFFQLDRRVLYHYWDPENIKDRETYRDRKNPRHQRALKRNLHLLGFERTKDKEALAEIKKYPLGTARSLEDYWRFMDIDLIKKTVGPRAAQGQWKNTPAVAMPRIFVSIASFRDPETQATVDNLFAKAAQPERIQVGICLQVDPKKDAACMVRAEGYPGQVCIKQVHHKESLGAGWARAEAFSLWQGEGYVLAIDSHMRFEQGWDEALIDMLNRCPPRSLLSTYAPRYMPPDTRDVFPGQILRTRVFGLAEEGNPQMLHVTKQLVPLADVGRSGLYRSPFIIANFVFCRPEVLQEVPFDPHIRFWGDEITLSARLWTHGYDIYQPDRTVLYHYWRRDELVSIQPYRNLNTAESRRSYARICHLLGFEQTEDKKALAGMDKYGLGAARPLQDLWEFAGIDWQNRQVSKDALEGRWNTSKALPRIFVNIASYRDAECQWAVKDLFEKAAHPERVFVGICWQYDAQADKHCFQVPPSRPEQVRLLPVDWRDAEGVCWARHQVQQLWEGEEYTLMIDSHMRFVPGWDELMIGELAACNSRKPVLSCSPTPYTPPNNLGKNMNPTVRRVKPFTAEGNIRCQGEMLDRVPEHPLRGAFIVANFVFSRSEIIREVPYDPYLYFDQEEVMYAARLYTYGWDVFSTRRQFLYHFYNDPKTSVRPLHWHDLHKTDGERIGFLRDRGINRFNHLTGYAPSSDPEVTRELDTYGFGTARTLAQFEEFTGIDFKRKVASEKALRGGYIEDLKKYRDKPFFVPELDKPPAAAPAPINLGLTTGDFIPMFDTVDESGQLRAIEIYAGRFPFLFFLSAQDVPYITQLLALLRQLVSPEMQEKIWLIFILDAPPEQLKLLKQQLGVSYSLWANPGAKIAKVFGASPPTGFLLSRNLKVLGRYDKMRPEALAQAIVADGKKALEDYRFKNRVPHTITELPPALIVPNAFTPELCEKCIQSFRTGHNFEGTVGSEEKLAYRPKAKIRTDHIVQPPLLEEIDEKLSRSLFPEIRKIFGFEVTHRELYKVGLYTGKKGGFFQRHRDNFEPPLGYRRIAMTLHLNNDYEGGGLHFPEYDENIYRPAAGSAIAFSCSTLHEARPVTGGERFVLVGFFHGEQDEAYRRQYVASKGAPLRIKDYTPSLPPDPPIRQGRDFYREWYSQHAHFDGFDGGQDDK